MRKSFNYGRDYMMVDELKEEFGVKPINMQRIKSNKYLISFCGLFQFSVENAYKVK